MQTDVSMQTDVLDRVRGADTESAVAAAREGLAERSTPAPSTLSQLREVLSPKANGDQDAW